MTGEIDWLPFVIARDTGQSLESVLDMPNLLFIAWQGFYTYERAEQEKELKRAKAKRRG